MRRLWVSLAAVSFLGGFAIVFLTDPTTCRVDVCAPSLPLDALIVQARAETRSEQKDLEWYDTFNKNLKDGKGLKPPIELKRKLDEGSGATAAAGEKGSRAVAPKGSDAEKWMLQDAKRNTGPDYWIGLYKNKQGNFLVEDDNRDARIFDSRGAFVAKANIDKMDGFMKGWPA